MAWEKAQAKLFVKRARERAGTGWLLLGADLQEALIAREFASVVTSQAQESIRTEDVEALWNQMLAIAGVRS